MHKQTSFVITAVILLTAVKSVSPSIQSEAANAQGNMSTAGKAMVVGKAMNNTGGANMTKSNMTGRCDGGERRI